MSVCLRLNSPAFSRCLHGLSAVLAWLFAATTMAQELDPRTYSNAPTGVNFFSASYGYSSGNVLLDPTLPIENLDGKINIGAFGYGRSFGLLGRNAKVKVVIPYAAGDWQGQIQPGPGLRSEDQQRRARGFGDIRAKLEWNFIGAPALKPDEYKDYKQDLVVGGSVLIVAPTSDYNSEKLLNLGSNRWVMRTEVGASKEFGRWGVELAGNIWLFGINDNFFGGNRSEQDPLYVIKSNIVYTWRPGLWLGAGVGYGKGGRTTINGTPRDNEQENYRYGLAFAYPFNQQHGLKVTLLKAENGGAGAEFDAFGLTYTYAWGF